VISSQVAILARENIKPLVRFCQTPTAAVWQVVNILGSIGHHSTLKHLGNLIRHPEPRVREETLQVLAKLGAKAQELIQKLLEDADPEIRGKPL